MPILVYGAQAEMKATKSSGSILKDLGFLKGEAEYLRIRADLLIQLQKALAERKLKQADAGELLGVSQPRISDIMRGRLDLFSIDTLVEMLSRLRIRVRLAVEPSKKRVA